MTYKKIIVLFLFAFLYKSSFAQQQMLPLGEFYNQTISFNLNKANYPVINTGFKPLLKSEINKAFNTDSVIYKTETNFFDRHKKTWFWKKLLFEDFISVKEKDFTLQINPLFYLQYGKSDKTADKYFINTRGIEIKGDIGKKLSYYSSFRENQARFRPYIYDWAWNRLVVPGQGALKKNNNDLSLYDFSSASGYLSYTPYNWLNIQAGQDKNFIGEGHRSLFLSDNTMNYPFVKFSFTYKNFKYITMFTQFRDFEGVYYNYHIKKHGAFNYLSYNFKNIAEIGLFEGLIYRTTDTSAYFNEFPADFFIPVIGIRTAVNGFASENNALAGINLKLKITNNIQGYAQFAVDDPEQRKYAYQAGIKVFDILHSKVNGLQWYFQTEYNCASTRTYSHKNLRFQTWSHYNQELAVPFGADFSEIFINSNLIYKRFIIDFRYNYIKLNNSNTYSDIYMLDDFVYITMPDKETVSHKTVTVSYTVNNRTGLQLYSAIDFRNENNEREKFIMFGIKTSLNNFYYDF